MQDKLNISILRSSLSQLAQLNLSLAQLRSCRTTRSNRKVVVTGQGSLCEAFKYEGLKFDPKTMQFTKKGKTLEKDFDMLEEWLDKKCEQSAPILSASATVSPSTPQLLPFQHHPFSHVPQMFKSPYPFHTFPYGHLQAPPHQLLPLSQVTPPATALPVTLTSCIPETNEPSAKEPEPEVRPRQRRILVSGSESSNHESDQESELTETRSPKPNQRICLQQEENPILW